MPKPEATKAFKPAAGYSPHSVAATIITYQTLLFWRVPINSIFEFITRTYKKVGFGRLK